MALEQAFLELRDRQRRLHESLESLRLAVAEDKPLQPEIALVDQRCAVVDDLLGWAAEACSAGDEGLAASRRPVDLDTARAALIKSQETFNSLSHSFGEDLLSYEAMAELTGIAVERGRNWHAWVTAVKSALQHCQQPIYEVNQALFSCWRELAERAGMNSVNVKNTAIGQKITMTPKKRIGSKGRI